MPAEPLPTVVLIKDERERIENLADIDAWRAKGWRTAEDIAAAAAAAKPEPAPKSKPTPKAEPKLEPGTGENPPKP